MEWGRISSENLSGYRDRALLADPTLEAISPDNALKRQLYLDGFQPPVAVAGLVGDVVHVVACNARYREATMIVRELSGLVEVIGDFLRSDAGARQAEWRQPGVGGRHYRLYLSRLAPAGTLSTRALVSMVDRTAEVEAERALRLEMLRDGLTGLPNRAAFVEMVEQAVAGGDAPGSFALLAIDLVRFSRVNEGVGALAGDELILTVAHRLRAVLPQGDVLARTAGDEFGALVRVPGNAGDALEIACALRDALTQPIRLSELEIAIDCSIGCAVWGDRVPAAADLLGNVQVALKRAKQTGSVELYRAGEVTEARRRFTLETDLRRAIERDELALAFQPQVNLETGRVTGFEALARWTHPEHGPVSPVEFIAVAEESGLIVPLGRWALARAARTLGAWDAAAGRALPMQLSVNVSAVQLARDSLVTAVEVSGIDTARLTLELTESSVVAEPERAARVLRALNERRCRVAMDDFGTGYSCLATLQRLPIDVLKIDRSLVSELHLSRDAMAIVRAVLSLARTLGMSTVAEGIERPEIATVLAAVGCTSGQGYHFARPLTPDAALSYFLLNA